MNPPLKLDTATSGKLISKPNFCEGLRKSFGNRFMCLCVYSTDLDYIFLIDMDTHHVTSPSKLFSFGWVFSSTWSNTTGSLAFKMVPWIKHEICLSAAFALRHDWMGQQR